MPILLFPSPPEATPAHKAVINAIVVCGAFFVLGHFFVIGESDLFPERPSTLHYGLALEPLAAMLVIVQGVRIGWLDWQKGQYDRMRFPLSGAELLTFLGFVSGFCLVQLFALPMLPVASGVRWTTYAFMAAFVLPGLIWTSLQDRAALGRLSFWPVLWRILMMVAIAASLFLSLNVVSAERTENSVLGYVYSKYSTTGPRGIGHYYHLNVTAPTIQSEISSLTIDYASWAQVRNGDSITLRYFRGGLRQDYWRYENSLSTSVR